MTFALARPHGLLMLAVLLALSPESCPRKSPWLAKDWSEWSRAECREMLLESPWSDFHYRETTVQWGAQNESASVFDSVINVQWRTAIPIRQAHVRLKKIETSYQQMTAEQRGTFDMEAERELASNVADKIVLRIAYLKPRYESTDQQGDLRVPYDVALLLANGGILFPVEVVHLPNQFELTDWGRIRRIEMDVTFPRAINGQQVIRPGDKSVTVLLGWRYGVSFRPTRQFEFKVADMIYNGKLEY